MDGARTTGAVQQAQGSLARLQDGAHFFQRVASINGFSGVEKESRQPDHLDTDLYSTGDLFQPNHLDASDDRGNTFTERNVLSVTILNLK
jgi:hypothetical protein